MPTFDLAKWKKRFHICSVQISMGGNIVGKKVLPLLVLLLFKLLFFRYELKRLQQQKFKFIFN